MRLTIDTKLVGALVLALTATIACAKKEAPAADTQTAGGAVATPSAEPANALKVADIGVGKKLETGNRIAQETTTFSARDTIFAAVHTTGAGQNANLTARWTFQDGQVVNERTETISPTTDSYTEFHISSAKGWPAGKYTLHVLLNGNEVQTKELEVKK
jgi:hypothetical protein